MQPSTAHIRTKPKRLLALLASTSILGLLPLAGAPVAQAAAYDGHPKLIVLVVIDQFRADYLQRYRSEFKGRGFRLFLDKGAYFPDCYYGYANTKTAPGHATLGTGAYTDGHGISSNEWWDLARNKQRPVSSVEDDRYSVIDVSPAAIPAGQGGVGTPSPAGNPAQGAKTARAPGASPRNLLASTFGDELRLATGGASRVFGVSLKDRAAILPAGAGANAAYWIDAVSGRFVSSTYYLAQLPQWAADFDSGPAIPQAAAVAGVSTLTNFYKEVGTTNAANTYELFFAEALIVGEGLGTRGTTDVLTISLSPNDIEGHKTGPDSPEEHAMVTGLDADLDGFFSWLDKNVPGGLANVVLALSADHGIAPTPAASSALGLQGAYIDTGKLVTDLNQAMNAKFSPGENIEYLLSHQELPYLSLNQPNFEKAGINEQEAEDAVKAAMQHAFASLAAPVTPETKPEPAPAPAAAAAAAEGTQANVTSVTVTASARPAPSPQLFRAYTRQQLAAGELPPTEFGRLLAHSYSPNGGWYVAAIPLAFQMEGKGSGTTHFSPWSYDRHVPLGFYGAPFLPGTYRGHVEPVDLAVTLASVLGINEPSAAVGHILKEALRPLPEFQYPKPPLSPARTRARRNARKAADDAAPTAAPDTPAVPAPSPSAAPAPEPGTPPAVTPPPAAGPQL